MREWPTTTSDVLAAFEAERLAKAKLFKALSTWMGIVEFDEMKLYIKREVQEWIAAEKYCKDCMQWWAFEQVCEPCEPDDPENIMHVCEEIGSRHEESEQARLEIGSQHDDEDTDTQNDDEKVDLLAILLRKASLENSEDRALLQRENQLKKDNVKIAQIRRIWVAEGNENKWFHLWQRAEEPTVERLLFMAAKAATENVTNEL